MYDKLKFDSMRTKDSSKKLSHKTDFEQLKQFVS